MLAFLAALSCCKLLFVVGENKITYLLTYRLIYSPTRINIHIGARSLVNLYGKCVTPESVSFHKTRCFIKPFKINNLPIKHNFYEKQLL